MLARIPTSDEVGILIIVVLGGVNVPLQTSKTGVKETKLQTGPETTLLAVLTWSFRTV